MKAPLVGTRFGGGHVGGDVPLQWEAGAALSRATPAPDPRPVGRTRKEQLSRPIMMCVSSGNGVGPRLTLDMSLSSCNQAEWACALRDGPPGLGAPQARGPLTRPTEVVCELREALERREPLEPLAPAQLSSKEDSG